MSTTSAIYDSKTGTLGLTATSPINIALIKYWGKVHEDLIIPANSSLSITIDQNDLCSKTRVELVDPSTQEGHEIVLILNGKEEKISARMKRIMDIMRTRTQGIKAQDENGQVVEISKDQLLKLGLRITSENNFATASGLASSSSGLSCLAFALAQLYGLEELFPGEYSKFARLGSGSACRSLYGGFVEWQRGFKELSELSSELDAVSDRSIAVKVPISEASLQWWLDNLQIFICVVKPQGQASLQKDVPSTDGMKISLETSGLMKLRLKENVSQQNIDMMYEALDARNFPAFAEITMKESNALHAVCLDTYPPIFYMNETSRQIIKAATAINSASAGPRVAYSIDAGFHVFVFTLKESATEVLSALQKIEGIDHIIQTRIGREGVKLQ